MLRKVIVSTPSDIAALRSLSYRRPVSTKGQARVFKITHRDALWKPQRPGELAKSALANSVSEVTFTDFYLNVSLLTPGNSNVADDALVKVHPVGMRRRGCHR
jgi:hypothetical protein